MSDTSATQTLIQQLLARTNQNTELAQRIFQQLFIEIPVQLDTIRTAIADKNYPQAEQITHTLHGSIRFCGFTAFQQTAKSLEEALMRHETASIDRCFDALENQLNQFLKNQAEIERFFSALKKPDYSDLDSTHK